MDDAPDLFVAADDGVELAFTSHLGEVAPVLFERFVGRLRVLGGDALGPAQFANGGGEPIAAFANEASGESGVLFEGEQQMLDG